MKTTKDAKWIIDIDREDKTRTFDWRRFVCPYCSKWQTYGETPYCPYCGHKVEKNEEKSK